MSKSNGNVAKTVMGIVEESNGNIEEIVAEVSELTPAQQAIAIDFLETVIERNSQTAKRIARSAVFQLVKNVRKDILFTGENSYTNIELVRKNKDMQVGVWDNGKTLWMNPEQWYNDSMLIFRFNVEHFVVSSVNHDLMKLNGIQRVVDTFWFATNGAESIVLGKDSKGDFYQSDFIALLNDDSYTVEDVTKKVRAMCNRAENRADVLNQRKSVYGGKVTLYGSWLMQNGRSDADLKTHFK